MGAEVKIPHKYHPPDTSNCTTPPQSATNHACTQPGTICIDYGISLDDLCWNKLKPEVVGVRDRNVI